jgi:uncharacterized membrane protein
MRWLLVLAVCIMIAAGVAGLLLLPRLPEEVASHWNAKGVADGYMSRAWSVLLLPLIGLLVIGLLVFLPRIDPYRKNVERFQGWFDGFVLVFSLFFAYVYALTLLWNMDVRFDMVVFLLPAFAVLFFFMGMMLSKTRMNWFIGIRTPWTLSSEKVWEKTHKFGGILFKIVAVIVLLSVFVRSYAFIVLLVAIFAAAIITVVYSYVIFKKLGKKK